MREFLIIMISLFMISCSNDKNSNNNKTKIRTIELNSATDVNYNPLRDAIKSIEFIPLETNRENLMGFINRVMQKNNRIYIFDHLAYKIHIFNSDGKWINTLNKKGKGPGEYLYIKNFGVDENDIIYVLTYGKILMYDNKLNFIGKIKIPDNNNRINDFYVFGKNNIVFYKTYDKNGDNSILQHFVNNEIVNQYGTINKQDNYRIKHFIKYNNKVNFIPPFYSNEIVSIDKNFNILKEYIIELDNKTTPKVNNPNIKIRSGVGQKNYTILTFLETNKYIYFTYNGSPVQHCLYNKDTESCYTSTKGWINGFILNVYNVSDDNEYLLGISSSISLMDYSKNIKANSIISEKQIEKLNGIKETDNPIVIKIKLKS